MDREVPWEEITMENVKIDWRNGRITGGVRMASTSGWIDIPLLSHVEGNLYQGGCKQGYALDDDFVKVVSLYQRERYEIADSTDRVEIRMYDSHDGVLEEDLFRASDEVLSGLEKGKTLVHCQAGLNRSGLVTAFTLMRQGMSAQDAIDKLRRGRDQLVLCNQTFVKQLHDLERRRSEWEGDSHE